jgi:enoyl-CoA hydratase
MIKAIDIALDEFEKNPKINGVLLKSAHERGFCAGGDIREVRQYILDEKQEQIGIFFAAEYGLDGKIASFPKPIIALTDGIIMGGGLGLAGHAKYRITTKQSRFAMPEAAIGFSKNRAPYCTSFFIIG